MLSVAGLLITIFVICVCSHIKDHSSQPHTPKIPVFFLAMPISFNYGCFTYWILLETQARGVVASPLGAVQLCLGTLSAGVESLAREIPSLFIKEVMIQSINHAADAFCGSKVLVILLKTNTFREKLCLLDLVSSLQLPQKPLGHFPEDSVFSFSLAEKTRMEMTESGGKGRLGKREAGAECWQLIKQCSENILTHKPKGDHPG